MPVVGPDSVAATLRSRGRIYGARAYEIRSYGGPPHHLRMRIPKDDWRKLMPARGRASRDDVEVSFTTPDGLRFHGVRGRLHRSSVTDSGWTTFSVLFDRDTITWTQPAVEHRPVCSGCQQPWPCEGAA